MGSSAADPTITNTFTSLDSGVRRIEAKPQAAQNSQQERSGFLDLPAELRIIIYELVIEDLLIRFRSYHASKIRMVKSQCTLLQVNAQIRYEACQHFRHKYLGLPGDIGCG